VQVVGQFYIHEKNVYDTLTSRDVHSNKKMVVYDFILCGLGTALAVTLIYFWFTSFTHSFFFPPIFLHI